MFKNLTGYEIDTLPRLYNLTDGHAFRGWSAAEEAIIDRSAQLFKNKAARCRPGSNGNTSGIFRG